MRPGKIAKAVVLITLLGFTLAASGCYGGFNLTRVLYKWNGNIQVNGDKKTNEVLQSAVMVVLWAIPVYQIAILADALVVNTLQFWTGKNPVQVNAEPIIRAVDKGDERYVQAFSRNAPGFLGCGRKALLAQPIDRRLDIAIGRGQCLLAVHHAGAGLLAKLLDERRSDFRHS